MNLFILSGHAGDSFAAFLNEVILFFKNAAVITAAVITTHHEIALRFRLQLRYLVIRAVVTAAVITAAFFKNNITSFKNAAKESPACPDNINKFILFWGKYHCFSVSIYEFIFILSRNPFY